MMNDRQPEIHFEDKNPFALDNWRQWIVFVPSTIVVDALKLKLKLNC